MNPALGIRTIRHKLRTVGRWPLRDRLLIPVVWVILGLARAAILTLPFRGYARFLGQAVGVEKFTPLLTPEQTAQARRIRRLVESTAKYTPWESKCLVQALVAAVLLQRVRVPYMLYFGLAKNKQPEANDPLSAHAWISAGAVPVTGKRSMGRFAVVGSYVFPGDVV